MIRMPWPRTLLWRTFLLISLLLGASLIAWFQIYRQYAQEPRTRQIAQLVVSVVNVTRSALLAADSTQRVALLQDLNAREGIRIIPAEHDDDLAPFPPGLQMRVVQEQIRQRLGDYTRFTGSLHGLAGFFISFRVDEADAEDEYWVMLPAERIERVVATHWIGWGIIAILSSLLGAWLLVLGINRPLKKLEAAARALGRGEKIEPLPADGPRELATLASAFNQMSSDLNQLESDRALILAGVSHDLRTPLARLRLGIELSGATSEDISAMGTDIDEMDRIINQFLDFARDQHAEAPSLHDLSTTLNALVETYRRRGVHIQAEIADSATLPLRIQSVRRAITNLIDNALRHAGADQALDIYLQTQGNTISVEVADRGPGIPPEEVERLKRPFTQLECARSNARGSGLGLAIVDRVARMHQGHLDLLPREGGGLRAILHLREAR